MSETYLFHHGILGQKWGVRRFQNPDGTLTNAGRSRVQKKRAAMVNEAASVLNKRASKDRDDAKYYRDSVAEFDKRYSGKDGYKKWLQDMYGDDWKDSKYMKTVFEVDDVEKHGKEGLAAEREERKEVAKMMELSYEDTARKAEALAKKYSDLSYQKISKKDYKDAKQIVKKKGQVKLS